MSDEQRDYETREGMRNVTIAGLIIIIGLVLLGMLSPQRPTQQLPLLQELVLVPTLMPTATPAIAVPTVATADPQISYDAGDLIIVNNQTTIYQDDHSYSYACIGYCP